MECAQRTEGCTHTCQRQLMASHLKESCQYVHVPCSQAGCEEFVLRKDVGKHTETCANRLIICEGCGNNVRQSDLEVNLIHYPGNPLRTNSSLTRGMNWIVLLRQSYASSALMNCLDPIWQNTTTYVRCM